MTLSGNITTISTALDDIKDAIIAKGVTPSGNITTYATAIGKIGTNGTGEYNVVVIDYDGTVLKSDKLDTDDTFSLPAAPTHSGLTFQGWSSPVAISNGSITVADSDIVIGAIYTTASGLSEFDVELNSNTGLTVNLNMNGTKNWGDGTTDTNKSHTYSSAGSYTITCNGDEIDEPYDEYYATGCFGNTYNNESMGEESSFLDSSTVKDYIKAIRFGSSITSIPFSVFGALTGLEYVTIPNTITTIGKKAFAGCIALKAFILPTGITAIADSLVRDCYTLEYFVINNGVTTVGNCLLYNCYNVKYLSIPSSVTTYTATANGSESIKNAHTLKRVKYPDASGFLGGVAYNYNMKEVVLPDISGTIFNSAFTYNTAMEVYDFRNCTAVPTLQFAPTNVFGKMLNSCVIKVPFDLYSEWIATTNWSTIADHIYGGVPATINITKTPVGTVAYINGQQVSNASIDYYGSSAILAFYDSTNDVIQKVQYADIDEGDTINVSVDLTSYNKVTLSTGVTGLDVKFNIGGISFDATEETSGDYSINVAGSGYTLDYFIDGGTNYLDVEGTVSVTGSAITQNVSMTACTIETWTRPDLSADGTIGGSSFAVAATNVRGNSYKAYKAVDGSTSTSWSTSYLTQREYFYYDLYNPTPICISQMYFNTRGIQAVDVQGSLDGQSWETITSSLSEAKTINLTNDKYYRYYKLHIQNSNTYEYFEVKEITITATYKAAVS